MTRPVPVALLCCAALVWASPLRAQERSEADATTAGEGRAGEDDEERAGEDDEGRAGEDDEARAGEDDDARGQDEHAFGARARVTRPLAGSELDPTASATTIDTRQRPRAIETLDEVLLEVPGARRQRTAGFGGFTSLSLRGAQAEHTTVVLGELPLATPDGSSFDLSSFPPWLLERIEVYRGGAPVWLGGGGIGGVLRLIPRAPSGTRLEASGGGGSFGLFTGRVGASVGNADAGVAATLSLSGATNDYTYRDDGRTALDPSDDREVARQNAQLLAADLLATGFLRLGDMRLRALASGLERVGGLAPPPTRRLDEPLARRSHVRALAALTAEWLGGDESDPNAAPARLALSLSAGVERRRTSDPRADFGLLPREADDTSYRILARGAGSLALADALDATVVALYWHDRFEPSDALARVRAPSSERHAGSLALELRAHGRRGDARFDVRPSFRLEMVGARVAGVRPEDTGESLESFAVMPTARVGVALEVTPGITFGASAATATRAPSLIELFGDRAYLIGRADLRPESSVSGDASVVLAGREGPISGRAELRAFGLHLVDLITWERVPGTNQASARNVDAALTYGAEVGAQGRFESLLSLSSALTFTQANDRATGRMLALRPQLTAYVRFEVTPALPDDLGVLGGWIDLEHVSASFADPENLVIVGEATRFGVGVWGSFLDQRLRIDLTVRDVFDARGSDTLGLPLPGRSFAGTVTVATN